eukprot:14096695-Alexandrium_andersonii.AAC.1
MESPPCDIIAPSLGPLAYGRLALCSLRCALCRGAVSRRDKARQSRRSCPLALAYRSRHPTSCLLLGLLPGKTALFRGSPVQAKSGPTSESAHCEL